jgi:glycosyltransferase involved in cell wall biosynthesis
MKLANWGMRHLAGIERTATRDATLIVTVSGYSAQRIVELYDADEKKIRVVPNGVDTQRFKPVEDCSKVREGIYGNSKHLVLFVGNLIPRKGLHFLIEAAKQVIKENKETKFVVVGEGPLKNHLIGYTKELGVANSFIFLQNVDDATLPAIYNCADILASPSIQEGQGITLLEAQATAKPVVAFNVTAINEVVKHKETGLLIKPDSSELADSILNLLSNKTLREKMGRSGRKFVSENFSLDICAKKMLQVYSEASKMDESVTNHNR